MCNLPYIVIRILLYIDIMLFVLHNMCNLMHIDQPVGLQQMIIIREYNGYDYRTVLKK